MSAKSLYTKAFVIFFLIAVMSSIAAAFLVHLVFGLVMVSAWGLAFAWACNQCRKEEDGKEEK